MKRDSSLRGPTASQERSGKKKHRPAPFGMTGWALALIRRSRSRGGFLAIDIFVADVALGISVNRGLIDPREHALHFSRRAHHQAARRNRGPLCNQSARRDDAARANGYAIQNDRAHAAQAARLDG